MRPSAFVFDVFGTLFSLEPLDARLAGLGLPGGSLRLWFARVLRDAFALEAAGRYRDFRSVGEGALEVLLAEGGLPLDRAGIGAVLDAFAGLSPHPDVRSALERLQREGIAAVTLGNGSAKVARALLERAELSPLITQSLSIEQVEHWKPGPAPYLHAAKVLGLAPQAVALVAAHAWDCQGAKAAGLRTAWVARLEKRYQPAFAPPDVQGETVLEAVERLLAG